MKEIAIVTELASTSFNKVAYELQKAVSPYVNCEVYDWGKSDIPEQNILFFGSPVSLTLKYCMRFLPDKNLLFYATVEGKPLLDRIDCKICKSLRIVAVSEFTKKQLESVGLNVEGVVPHGVFTKPDVDDKHYKYLRRILKGSHPVYLTVSSNTPRKGLSKLLTAWKLVERKLPNAMLILHSASGALDIAAMANQLEIDNLWFTNALGLIDEDKLQALYKVSDAIVVPSLTEGFCLPIIEGGLHKKPSIAVKALPFTELIGEVGLLFPCVKKRYVPFFNRMEHELKLYKVNSLADAMIAMSDDKLREELGEKMRERVIKKFDITKTAQELLNYFLEEKKEGRAILERRTKISPTSIAYLSTLPGAKCGIASYTNYLSQEVSKHYPTNIYRNIYSNIPKDSLIVASIEFGIFPNQKILINKEYLNNYKIALWHTVLKNPSHEITKYVRDIDDEYDCHIVHTVLGKTWLSKYVSKPVYLIPHPCAMWNPIPREEARRKLGLPKDAEIAFCFGFAAKTKGMEEVIAVAEKIKRPKFLLVISGSPHGIAKAYTEKLVERLQKTAGENVMVLGRYLSDDEINLWCSASDVLIFNYKTPPTITSASGALKRVLAAGKPIVGVNDNRLEELVDGQHILKFTPGDLDDFAHCINLVFLDKGIANTLGTNCRLLAEETSWEKMAKKHLELYGKVVGNFFGPNYYDEEYFVGRGGGKTYVTQDGKVEKWSYFNPDGEWLGAKPVMEAIKTIFNPKNMLSVGEGRGTFCAYARDVGINAIGIDFSKWAVEHPYPRAKGLLQLGDVRDIKFGGKTFYFVFCSDIMEHLYLDDLSKAISEIRRVSRRWIFYNIAVPEGGQEVVLKKEKLPHKKDLGGIIAGHCTVKTPKWWRGMLCNNEWKPRDDLVEKFRKLVPKDVLSNWKFILITERVKK